MNAQVQPAASEQQIALAKELEILRPEIAKVLPEHVPPDKFMRIVATAIAQSPGLRKADRRTLFTSCVKCATDGLVPDGREAALVIFGQEVQYMPMVGGILKKVRNSGELASIVANVVYEKDDFNYWVDDLGEHVTHKPAVLEVDRGKFLAVYAIAKTKDGGSYVEVMSRGQIEQVKAVSRAGDKGPWGAWYDEMSRKTVIRRLSKRLPMSTDLETVIQRDDQLYDLNKVRNGGKSGTDAAKELLGIPMLPDPPPETVDKATGEVTAAATEAPGESNVGKVGKPLPEGFDIGAEEKALRATKSLKGLMTVYAAIAKKLDGAEMPIELSAAHGEMRESFAEKE